MKSKRVILTLSATKSRKSAAPQAGILQSQSGQALLEVALLTPLLLALLVGAIELGRYAYISILVGNATRAGAAYGAQSLALSVDKAGIQTAADNDFKSNGQLVSNLTVTSSDACGCDSAGTTTSAPCATVTCPPAAGHWVVMVSVTASGTFNSLFNFPGIPKSISVSRTSTIRVVQD